ncbi:MAG TPA: hypothetical protein VIT23_05045 [Terrimicrobiaceae bacterium]
MKIKTQMMEFGVLAGCLVVTVVAICVAPGAIGAIRPAKGIEAADGGPSLRQKQPDCTPTPTPTPAGE